MSSTEILKVRVSTETKLQAKRIARQSVLTESAWLKGLVIREIGRQAKRVDGGVETPREFEETRPRSARTAQARPKSVFVRLRREDHLLLEARSEARGMRPATYVSVLTRSHLRSLTPLPKEEYLALKRSISELASIGRNINQIVKAANAGGSVAEFRAMLRICVALRDNTKALLKANETSWATGLTQLDV
jgi:hypothetical protein